MRLLLLVAAALSLSACESPKTSLDEHELAVAAQQVASLAGEGAWLAQQLRTGGVTRGFVWVHQQSLGEDAVKVSQQLAKPVPDSLRPAYETVSRLDTQLQAQVSRIAGAAERPDELDALQREFHGVAQQAQPLAAKAFE